MGSQVSNQMKSKTTEYTPKMVYQCKVCSRTFNRSSSLETHSQLVHNTDKQCKICNKTFTTISYLRNHTKIHTGDRAFQCKVCLSRFILSSQLKVHQRIVHEGEKRHVCKVCNKGFPYLNNLKRHTMMHTGEKPFECDVCSNSFRYLRSLHRHKESFHSDKNTRKVCTKPNLKRPPSIDQEEKNPGINEEQFQLLSKIKIEPESFDEVESGNYFPSMEETLVEDQFEASENNLEIVVKVEPEEFEEGRSDFANV